MKTRTRLRPKRPEQVQCIDCKDWFELSRSIREGDCIPVCFSCTERRIINDEEYDECEAVDLIVFALKHDIMARARRELDDTGTLTAETADKVLRVQELP